jgi:hypothetical protein
MAFSYCLGLSICTIGPVGTSKPNVSGVGAPVSGARQEIF